MFKLFGKRNELPVIRKSPMGMRWNTEDPFTYASHHKDDYPAGNAQQAPPLEEIGGRNLGRDYQLRFGYRMYNGKVVPGFPMHAHWGYETITVPMKGYIDHFDNLGNSGRLGPGDVAWVTAGGRYSHCEMYPLDSSEGNNPNDVTQIMLNLSLAAKSCGTSMEVRWSSGKNVVEENGVSVMVVLGTYGNISVSPASKDSWAADPNNCVRILRIEMKAGTSMRLNAVSEKASRNLYMTDGSFVSFNTVQYPSQTEFKLSTGEITITNGDADGVFWLLEGVPIGEKQVSYGPVILGSDKAVRTAMEEIRTKEYGEWPWGIVDKTNPKGSPRFVRYSDGREEFP